MKKIIGILIFEIVVIIAIGTIAELISYIEDNGIFYAAFLTLGMGVIAFYVWQFEQIVNHISNVTHKAKKA